MLAAREQDGYPHHVVSKLEVLRCTACGSVVAVADAESVRCSHCGQAVAMPAEQRQALANERSLAVSRQHAEALLQETQPPSWPLRPLLPITCRSIWHAAPGQ